MKRYNSKFVNDVLAELNRTSKYLTEAYIFNEDGYDEEGYEDEGYGMHGENPEMYQQRHQEVPAGEESVEEKAMHAQEIIKHEPIIAKIRETAIEGLKKYADNPTSDIYAFFKDVFLSSDKLLTGKNSK